MWFLFCLLILQPRHKVHVNVNQNCSTSQLICIWSCSHCHWFLWKLGPRVQKPKYRKIVQPGMFILSHSSAVKWSCLSVNKSRWKQNGVPVSVCLVYDIQAWLNVNFKCVASLCMYAHPIPFYQVLLLNLSRCLGTGNLNLSSFI